MFPDGGALRGGNVAGGRLPTRGAPIGDGRENGGGGADEGGCDCEGWKGMGGPRGLVTPGL